MPKSIFHRSWQTILYGPLDDFGVKKSFTPIENEYHLPLCITNNIKEWPV